MDADERREVVLDEIRQWRAEGVLDAPTADLLESRYGGPGPLAGGTAAPGGVHAPAPRPGFAALPPSRGGFATNALQFVGGLLLGAALVALVFFLDLPEEHASWILLLFGGIALAAGHGLHLLDPKRDGLAEALLAAGLVPAGVAALAAEDAAGGPLLLAVLVCALAVATHALRRGNGPSIVLAGTAFTIASFMAIGFDFFDSDSTGSRLGWLAAMLGYLALLLVWRRETWTTVGLALFVFPLTTSFILTLDIWGVNDSVAAELVVGLWLAGLLALGISLGNRGLVTGAAAGLTIDAAVFAFDLGGAGTAVVVLLALGGVLVWQAELLRSYFARGPEDKL